MIIYRFNAFFATELTRYQPISEEPKVTLNSLRYRGLDGFVAAVSPFNFTAIGGNLSYTPALMVGIRLSCLCGVIFRVFLCLTFNVGMRSVMETIRHCVTVQLDYLQSDDGSRRTGRCSEFCTR